MFGRFLRSGPKLRLKVVEARQVHEVVSDEKKVGLTPEDMQALGITDVDFVKIDASNGTTVAGATTVAAEKGTIIMNDLNRGNAHAKEGEWADVSKTSIADAKKVVLASSSDPLLEMHVDETLIQFVKKQLLGIPFAKGDTTAYLVLPEEYRFVVERTHEKWTPRRTITHSTIDQAFVVVSCDPDIPARIAEGTTVSIRREPIVRSQVPQQMKTTQVTQEALPVPPRAAMEDGWRWETAQENRREMKRCPLCGTWNPKANWKCRECLHEFPE